MCESKSWWLYSKVLWNVSQNHALIANFNFFRLLCDSYHMKCQIWSEPLSPTSKWVQDSKEKGPTPLYQTNLLRPWHILCLNWRNKFWQKLVGIVLHHFLLSLQPIKTIVDPIGKQSNRNKIISCVLILFLKRYPHPPPLGNIRRIGISQFGMENNAAEEFLTICT